MQRGQPKGHCRAPIKIVFKSVGVRQNHSMRNPDKWSPMEPEEPESEFPKRFGRDGGGGLPTSRRGALVGLVIILLLVVGGLLLTRVLRGMSQLQDCALSGRPTCTGPLTFGQPAGVVRSASAGYSSMSSRITPLVQPKPSCSGYSPPPPLR